MRDFEALGGGLEYARLEASDIAPLAQRFDLVAVCTGRSALGQAFARETRHALATQPLRRLRVGLYRGIREPEPRGVTLSVCPGEGELIELPILSFEGMVTALLAESIPGSRFEKRLHADPEPRRAREALLELIAEHFPDLHARIDPAEFELTGAADQLQGAVTPAIRESYRELGGGVFAIALGDLHASVDPLVGQGANAASHAAWVLGEEIVRQDVFDARFCEQVDARRMDRILCASRWTELMLRPPSPELEQLIERMSRDRALCDEFTDGFNEPERQWDRLASPARIRAWIEASRARMGEAGAG